MSDGFRIPTGITTGRVVPEESGKAGVKQKAGGEFEAILQGELQKADLKFSAHVVKRMQDRSISFSNDELTKIRQAVDKAESKGIRDSLVVINDVSLIISIRNKTVITAVNNKNLNENVITNIDGAVFI
ncbi:MAG: flagellar biosynthesis protein [Clostridiales bacterium]|jgi:flagellar operon protein|nr:flagellar biosynthesis protein [Clostridiales bacterium]